MTGSKGKRIRKWASLMLIAVLLGGTLSGCIPHHGSVGQGGTSGHQHAH